MGPCQAAPFPRPQCHPLLSSQGLLLSSTNTLGQNANRTNFPAAYSSRSTAHPKGMQSQPSRRHRGEPFTAAGSSQSQWWELLREHLCCLQAWGSPRSSAHAVVPRELLTPLHLVPRTRGKPRPRELLWPSPSLWLWQPPLPLIYNPHCSLGHQRPPASSLLRTLLGDQRLSTVTSSRCPSTPAVTPGTVPLMPGTIPGTGGPGSDAQSPDCPAPAQEQPHFSLLERWDGSTAHVKTQDTRAGSKFLAGRAALNFPWMPITWLKAEP